MSTPCVLLLDIDETLIDSARSGEIKINWNGGVKIWQDYLSLLTVSCAHSHLPLHIGLASYKKPIITRHDLRGDILCAAILEDRQFYEFFPKTIGLGDTLGLKKLIDKDLIFLTGSKSKSTHALAKAKEFIENKYGKSAAKDGKYILVDDDEGTCDEAIVAGYNALCVFNLSALSKIEKKIKIANTFRNIYVLLKLPIPYKIREDILLWESQLASEAASEENEMNNFPAEEKNDDGAVEILSEEDNETEIEMKWINKEESKKAVAPFNNNLASLPKNNRFRFFVENDTETEEENKESKENRENKQLITATL